MPRNALVLSVPGSGTNFARQYIEEALGYTRTDWIMLHEEGTCSRVSQMHTMQPAASEYEDIAIVVPLRDPHDTTITRSRSDKKTHQKQMAILVEAWHRLINMIDRYDAVFLPIDTDDRRGTLEAIVRHLQAQIVNQKYHEETVEHWRPVNSQAHNRNRGQPNASPVEFARPWYQSVLENHLSQEEVA